MPVPGRRSANFCSRLPGVALSCRCPLLSFAPGEAFQFDWSEDFAVIGGTRVKLQVAHTKLCHSRAYLLQTHDTI